MLRYKDRERIFKVEDCEVGFSNINIMIFARMRTWVIKTTETARRIDDPDNLALRMDRIVWLRTMAARGGPTTVCLWHVCRTLGVDHPDTLFSVKHLGSLRASDQRRLGGLSNHVIVIILVLIITIILYIGRWFRCWKNVCWSAISVLGVKTIETRFAFFLRKARQNWCSFVFYMLVVLTVM